MASVAVHELEDTATLSHRSELNTTKELIEATKQLKGPDLKNPGTSVFYRKHLSFIDSNPLPEIRENPRSNRFDSSLSPTSRDVLHLSGIKESWKIGVKRPRLHQEKIKLTGQAKYISNLMNKPTHGEIEAKRTAQWMDQQVSSIPDLPKKLIRRNKYLSLIHI